MFWALVQIFLPTCNIYIFMMSIISIFDKVFQDFPKSFSKQVCVQIDALTYCSLFIIFARIFSHIFCQIDQCCYLFMTYCYL